MNISFNAEDKTSAPKGKFVVKPGTYGFKVVEVKDKVDKKGKDYVNLLLEVDIGSKYPQRCYVNIWNRKDFKDRRDGLDTLSDLVMATGLEVGETFNTNELVGKSGVAAFTTEEWKGYTNLKYDKKADKGSGREGENMASLQTNAPF